MEATSEFVLRIKTEVENVSETVFLDLKIVKIKVIKMMDKKLIFVPSVHYVLHILVFCCPLKRLSSLSKAHALESLRARVK